jgi:putative tryptophan/tyrosine transport system substrate-binding protein
VITRRNFSLGLIALCPATLLGQARQAPVSIGWLSVASPDSQKHYLAAFREGLEALGSKQDSRAHIEERWAYGHNERLRALAGELVASRPAVIVTASLRAVKAAVAVAPKTPIVVAAAGDLVAEGFAASLARPGGMVTGITNLRSDLAEKYLELLLAAVPHVTRIGFIYDSNALNHSRVMAAAQRSVKQRAIDARFVEVAKSDDIELAMSRLAKDRINALIVMNGFTTDQQRIVKLALAQRWPVIAPEREFVEHGALMSYAIDTSANYRRAAYYVDRILKGAKPGDLPIEQPTKFELVVNPKGAKALGLTIPQELLLRADKVIE